MLAGILQPGGQVVECVTARDVVGKEGTGRAPVVRPGDGAKRFLTGLHDMNADVTGTVGQWS